MLQGHFDAIDHFDGLGWFAKGWAFDAEAPDRSVSLELWCEKGLLLRFQADGLRTDLAAAGFGTGHCAFEVRLPEDLLDGAPHMLHIVSSGPRQALDGCPRMFAMPRLRGRLERVCGLRLEGWAKDEIDPERPAVLDVLVDGHRTGQLVCSLYRSDLSRSLGTSGHNAFQHTLPLALCDGRPHEIVLRFTNTDIVLNGSPHAITLSPELLTTALTMLDDRIRDFEQRLGNARTLLGRTPLCRLADSVSYWDWLRLTETWWQHSTPPEAIVSAPVPLISVIAGGGDHGPGIAERLGRPHGGWEILTAGDGIPEAAVRRAHGRFILLLPPGHVPHPALLDTVGAAVAGDGADAVYTDEDLLGDDGRRSTPHFKPDWDPDRFLATAYVGGACCIRRSTLIDICESLPEGATSWPGLVEAALLRLAPERVQHIPHVLVHRTPEGSTTKRADVRAARLQRLLDSLGAGVRVEPSNGDTVRVRWPVPGPGPAVTLIIPTRDRVDLLRTCVDSILERTRYRHFSILVIDNGSEEEETLDYLATLSTHPSVRVLRRPGPFNYSALNNEAVALADTPLIGLINNDVEVIEPDWLGEMVSHALRPDVGVVGAKLLYPDGRIQHGGVVVGFHGVADNVQQAFGRDDPGYFHSAVVTQNATAVTAACLICRREVYQSVGGLDAEVFAVSFNDVDFCLKVRDRGLRVIWTPHALLYHHESASRGAERSPEAHRREEWEADSLRLKWRTDRYMDPFYSPNLARTGYSHTDFAWPEPGE